ncbi:calcium-binding protein [Sphingomonas humi]|uniref:calcium-binding protein n=1 Tax=Sphingomonas humi TaxID=335630 RepID=UPI0031D20C7C
MTIGGDVVVVGTTSGGEVITILYGNVVLDPSFNTGGDTIRLPFNAADISVRRSGAQVTFEGAGLKVSLPAGSVGTDISFNDAVRILSVDSSSGLVKLGYQTITSVADAVEPAGPPPTIVGTEVANTIKGTVGNDVIYGLGGNDSIDGGAGNDIIRGGLGDDTLTGSLGNDEIYGGPGADRISDSEGDSAFLDGGADNDNIVAVNFAGTDFRIFSGDGNDYIGVAFGASGSAMIDAGPGADRVMMSTQGLAISLSLGSGSDELVLPENALGTGNFGVITVKDFDVGTAGDRIDFVYALSSYLTNWDQITNPFVSGHLKLIDRGSAAVLQVDRDGSSSAYGFKDLLVFESDTKASFTKENFGGYDPQGSQPPSTNIFGTEGPDTIKGSVGNDIIDGLGGNDSIDGGAGNDIIRGGLGNDTLTGSLGNDEIYGGPGADRLSDYDGNSALLDGGADTDNIVVVNFAGTDFRISGGDGDDYIGVAFGMSGSATIDAGTGTDRVMMSTQGLAISLSLGSGSDDLVLPENALGTGTFGVITVKDFEVGPIGDRIDFVYALSSYLTNWDQITNPFVSGHLKLIDRGSATVLQVDRDGSSSAYGFKDLLVFEGDAKASFTKENFGGYDPQGLPPAAAMATAFSNASLGASEEASRIESAATSTPALFVVGAIEPQFSWNLLALGS